MATNDGSLSHPSYLILDGAAIAAQTVEYGEDVACSGFDVAVIEGVADKQWSLYVLGTADPGYTGAADPPDLYDGLTKIAKENTAANAGVTLIVDIRGLRFIRISVYNTDGANAATASLRVTLK